MGPSTGRAQPPPPATHAASPPPPPEGPRFAIETIAVDGISLLSTTSLLNTAQLEEGHAYSESQLGQAMARIVRLPLVLDAEFSLEKGSSRGLYHLQIRVEEVRRWVFGLYSEATWWAHDVSVDGLATTDRVDGTTLFAGRRFALGPSLVAFGVVSGDGELTAGVSRYDPFGRGGLATLSVSTVHCEDVRQQIVDSLESAIGHDAVPAAGSECRTQLHDVLDPTASTWSAGERTTRFRLDLGVPLRRNHSLLLRGEARRSDSGIRRSAVAPVVESTLGFEDREDQRLELAWRFDSVDDPLFPTDGARLQAGIEWQHLTARLGPIRSFLDSTTPLAEMDSSLLGLSLGGELHRSFGARQSLGVSGRILAGERKVDDVAPSGLGLGSSRSTVWRLQASLQHSLLLHSSRRHGSRELRWTQALTLFDGSSFAGSPAAPDFERGFEVSSGLSFRSPWGVVSLRLAYLDRGKQ